MLVVGEQGCTIGIARGYPKRGEAQDRDSEIRTYHGEANALSREKNGI